MIFYFFAEDRVDFRDLVRDLAQTLHTRIEMKQIGNRDETKLIGGVGPCGRELCCSSWLREFSSVSVKMAKEQGLSLNPSKLAGMCGRLKCCLRYEYDTYLELGRALPPIGTTVESVKGDGVVTRQNVLKQTVIVRRDEDGVEVEATLEDLVRRSAPTDAARRPPLRMGRVYVTTPIYYVNAEPHLGHTYTTVVADTLARWHRAARRRDAASSPAPTSTATRSRRPPRPPASTPRELRRPHQPASSATPGTRAASRYDHFIRTTDADHVAHRAGRSCSRVHAAGDIYFGSYGGLYCTGCERFYTEKELVDGKCPDHQVAPTLHRGRELLLPHEQVPGAPRSTTSRRTPSASCRSATATRCSRCCAARRSATSASRARRAA